MNGWGDPDGVGRRPLPLVPPVLLLLALADLRVEFMILADHFTLAAVAAAIRSHLLAVSVLVLQPSLWMHYRRRGP
jgi:hypothetical protein